MPNALSTVRESALPRMLDRLAGTPLLWLLGALRRKRTAPAEPLRVGLMMFETIGDTLLAATLVASLRQSMPRARIVVFASRGNRGVLPLLDGIDSVVDVPLTRPAAAIAAVRSLPVDVMIDIGQWPRWYAVLCALSRSRCTIGFDTAGQGRHYAYDIALPHRADLHEVQNFQRLLTPFAGVRPLPPAAALRAIGAAPAAVAARGPYVVMHPWASGFRYRSREWPLTRWVALIERACAQGLHVLLSGSTDDRGKAEALLCACPPGLAVTSIAGDVSLAELAAVLRNAAAVVAVNTGVMHLAGVLDAPLVALHGPTSRLRWGPTGSRSIAVAPVDPVGCEFLNLGFEYPSGAIDCMERISVDQVFSALMGVLRRNESAPAKSTSAP